MSNFFDKHTNKIFLALALIQLSVLWLVSVGAVPTNLLWLNFGLVFAGIMFLSPIQASGLFLVSLPFMGIFPNGIWNNLPTWRVLLLELFVVVVAKLWWQYRTSFSLITFVIKTYQRLFLWEKLLIGLFAVMIVSLLVARFPEHGFKQILFLFNTAFIYVIARTLMHFGFKDQFIKYVKNSLFIIVGLGYLQYILSWWFEPYYFWQYWAAVISSLYYGTPLANVLAYSNSWFSSDNGGTLRMFGILQDTHAFGILAVFALCFWVIKAKKLETNKIVEVIKNQNIKFWLGLILISFAVIASGTRGVWLSMMAPMVLVMAGFWIFRARVLSLLPSLAYVLIVLLFALSPFISLGINALRSIQGGDHFLDRAASIYDLQENSNAGRIEIWQSSFHYSVTHPLGTGYGNFISSLFPDSNAESYDQLANQKNFRYNLPQRFITAHSLYLHVLVELGLLGFIVFIAVILTLAQRVFHYLKSVQFAPTQNSILITNISLVLVWLLAYGVFDVTILNERVLIYTFALTAILTHSLQETK